MKKILFVLLFVSVAILTGCRHESQNGILSKVEGFLPLQPDSADAYLHSVDLRQLTGDDEKASYALLRTMTDVLLDKGIASDTLIGLAYNHFSYQCQKNIPSDQTTIKHFAQSALYMGDWYSSQDSVKLSEDYYRQAIKYSEKVEDWHTCYLAYERLAEQVQWGNEEEALKLIEKGIQIYGKCNDKIENLLSLYAYAAHYSAEIAYRDRGDFHTALDYAYKVYDLAIDSCLTSYEDQSLASLAEIYWEMGEYQKALDFAKKIKITELDSEYSLVLNMKIAQYYLSCDSVAKAKELCLAPKNVGNKKLAYLYARELAEISVKQLNPDSIILYMDSAFSFSEGMLLDALKTKDDYLRETLEKVQENAYLTYRNKNAAIFFGMLLLLCLLAVYIIVMHIKRYKRGVNERERLLHTRLSELEHQLTIKEMMDVEKEMMDSPLVNSFHEMAKSSVKKPTLDEWGQLRSFLRDKLPAFWHKLHECEPPLRIEEIDVCLLIRLQFKAKDIANLTGMSLQSISNIRRRLLQRVFHQSEGGSKEFDRLIMKL